MQLIPNQLVELHLDSPGGPQIYRTRVEDVYDDIVVMGAPLERGSVVPIRIGTEVTIQFKKEGIWSRGRFSNRAVVEKRFRTAVPSCSCAYWATGRKPGADVCEGACPY